MGSNARCNCCCAKFASCRPGYSPGQEIMADHNTEVELRYKVHDPNETIANLEKLGIKNTGKKHLIDQWFMPNNIRSMEMHEDWFNKDRGVAWRIRRTEQPDGSFKVEATSKQLTEANNHDTFIETDAGVSTYDEAMQFVKDKGYYCWLTIDKTRYDFTSPEDDFEIVLDEIEGLAEK